MDSEVISRWSGGQGLEQGLKGMEMSWELLNLYTPVRVQAQTLAQARPRPAVETVNGHKPQDSHHPPTSQRRKKALPHLTRRAHRTTQNRTGCPRSKHRRIPPHRQPSQADGSRDTHPARRCHCTTTLDRFRKTHQRRESLALTMAI
jgi:hypothetical protein